LYKYENTKTEDYVCVIEYVARLNSLEAPRDWGLGDIFPASNQTMRRNYINRGPYSIILPATYFHTS
jgi:hypothetical protein